MNSITKYQLAAAVLLSEGFTLLCIRGSITLLTLAGYTAGTLLQYAAAVPVMKLCRSGLSDCGKPALAVILLCLTGWGGISLALLYQTSDAVYIPFEGSGLAGAPSALKKYCKGATVGKGLAIHGADAARSESTVSAWAGKNLA